MNSKFYFIIPWCFCCIIVLAALLLGFTYELPKFDKVLDSVITFGSIILGFLSALLGILITIQGSSIMKRIYDEKQDVLLKSYFFESIGSGFIVIIFSTIMHVLIDDIRPFVRIIFFIWMFSLSLFLFSSYRIISLLMKILFKSDLDSGDDKNKENKQKKITYNIPVKKKEDKALISNQTLTEIETGDKNLS
ncbi:hypothetical protein [Paenibacillus woosongensis]|uniref:Uncharacterized protein n=1 Tax=Paenibacillus woosongensis TaxID=307580 RepID=A0A7X2Z019_9BACL|nr:hypothetical protein [Paenibacillus woosongensis]MUG44930.1 hypothetical protein [Paenibacillus woosongensis]